MNPFQRAETMNEGNSTTHPTQSKPSKPYPECPLFHHATGRGAKKPGDTFPRGDQLVKWDGGPRELA